MHKISEPVYYVILCTFLCEDLQMISQFDFSMIPQPISETSLDLTGLIPYALYQFRVLWVVTPRHILTSNTTQEIRMDESGGKRPL